MRLKWAERIACAENGPLNRGPCKLCERKGVPIFPARRALVPLKSFVPSTAPEGPIETELGWRTLRAGYLYVLLDRLHWQAYQVSADGYLRRFDPYVPPPANNFLLPDKCTAADHDCPSSFITVDIDKYSVAAVAFSSDPWTPSVLDAYMAGRGRERFRYLVLSTLREHPAAEGMAMTPDKPAVDDHFLEYQAHVSGRFNTAHTFYTRAARIHALKRYVKTSMERYRMPNGLPVLGLDDPVGLVQEYNHQRNAWVYARQQWMADPDRAYQYQTSQILLAIRALHPHWAEEQIPVEKPVKRQRAPFGLDSFQDRPRLVKAKAKDFDQRLEERYDEAQRAQFQRTYEREFARYQEQIDREGASYAKALKDSVFITAEEHDYDGEDFESARAYVITLAACLRGGISDAPVAPGEDDSSPLVQQWKTWLENPQSPIYRALLMRNSKLLAGLLPSFSAEGEIHFNDSLRIYDALTKTLSSDEGNQLRRALLHEAIADLQGAMNAASARLQPVLSPTIERVVSRLNSITQLLYNGIHLVEIRLQMTAGEYYALQSEHLRNLQRKAAEALANAPRRIVDGLVDMEAQWIAEKARKVRPIILGGVLNLAGLDPKIASTTFGVSIWVQGAASELRETLALGANLGIEELSRGLGATMQSISVGTNTLDPRARQALNGLRISSQQVAGLLRESLTGLRGVAGSGSVLMATGSLYLLSDMMTRNLEAVSEVIGDKSPEAKVAFYGSAVGVTGAAVELVGLAVQKGAQQLIAANRLAARGMGTAKEVAAVGKELVRVGATVAAAAGVFDSIQAGMAMLRVKPSGDSYAGSTYLVSAIASAIGAGAGVASALTVATALFGVLGVAIVFGIIGYGLYKLAEGFESTPLEAWARRCFFGIHNEEPPVHWNHPEDSARAIASLNAITLGLEAGVHFKWRTRGLGTVAATGAIGLSRSIHQDLYVEYRLHLPYFDATKSAYSWTVAGYPKRDEHRSNSTAIVLAQGGLASHVHKLETVDQRGGASLKANPTNVLFADAKNRKLEEGHLRVTLSGDRTLDIKTLNGWVSLMTEGKVMDIQSVILSLRYWPDRDIAEGCAEISLQSNFGAIVI